MVASIVLEIELELKFLNMEYQDLGESGLKVSKVIVGCMSFGSKSWASWAIEDEEEVFPF